MEDASREFSSLKFKQQIGAPSSGGTNPLLQMVINSIYYSCCKDIRLTLQMFKPA